jgi:hypothetical protein
MKLPLPNGKDREGVQYIGSYYVRINALLKKSPQTYGSTMREILAGMNLRRPVTR